jgi:hypothetical protein
MAKPQSEEEMDLVGPEPDLYELLSQKQLAQVPPPGPPKNPNMFVYNLLFSEKNKNQIPQQIEPNCDLAKGQ